MAPTRRNPNRRCPACWPSDKKVAQARYRIREMTARNRRRVLTHKVVADLNDYLRGWRQYYRFGNSTVHFSMLDHYVDESMALLLSKRHGRRGRGHGLERLAGTIDFGRTVHTPGERRRQSG